MLYRPDIDGLRAVAVLPVILFHAGFAAFSGGFVGVDIFFVISGYLITGIILSELAAGDFSIVRFYERRARRILPALFFVITVSIGIAWFWLLPGDMRNFSASVLAVALFFRTFFSGAPPITSKRPPNWRPCCTPGVWRSRSSSICSFRCFSCWRGALHGAPCCG